MHECQGTADEKASHLAVLGLDCGAKHSQHKHEREDDFDNQGLQDIPSNNPFAPRPYPVPIMARRTAAACQAGHTAGKENKNKGTDEFRKVFSDTMISF